MEVRAGYKRTDAGIVPEEWVSTRLGDFIELQRGHDLTWRDRQSGDVPVMGSAGHSGFHNVALAKGPGVVLGRSGASFGQAHYCKQDFWPHNTALYVTDFLGNDPLFAFYLLSAFDFTRHNSGGAQQSLNRNFIAPIPVGIPRPPEQCAIATALSDADALLDGLDRLIAKKRDLKQAAMQQLLTGQTRLPGFHGEWEVKRLEDLLTYEQPTKYLVSSSEYGDANDVPVLTAGKTFVLGYTNEDDGIFSSLPVIIFDDFTTAAKYVTFPFKAKSSAMKLLKPRNPSVNLRLVYEMMQLIAFKLSEHKRYWIAEYQKLEVKIPDEKEQAAIMNVLSGMDAELSALEARRDKTRALKQGMMQELLTGRTRLT